MNGGIKKSCHSIQDAQSIERRRGYEIAQPSLNYSLTPCEHPINRNLDQLLRLMLFRCLASLTRDAGGV